MTLSSVAASLLLGVCLILPTSAFASSLDTDQDGLADEIEARVFGTNANLADTDGDGFADGEEIRTGHDPNKGVKARLKDADADNDGLFDRLEIMFATNPLIKDTDGDGFTDGEEVKNGYDPLDPAAKNLEKRIRVDLSEQRLYQEVNGVAIASHVVSSGKASTPTPVGTYEVLNKHPRAWSRSASLWMPYWMAFRKDGYGLHELPEWPGGKKEGKAHLGTPVSHGCVRVGEGVAKALYEWTPVGTKVVIQR